jgi:hypothetical protein
MKIRPVGAELFHVDIQTDRHDEAKVSPRNVANAPETPPLRAIFKILNPTVFVE